MLALYALGRQHDALSAYRSFRGRLDEELGLEPTPETRALESAILRQDDVRSLLPRPIVHEHAPSETRRCDCSDGRPSWRHSTARYAAGSRARPRSPCWKGKPASERRACSTSSPPAWSAYEWDEQAASELEWHLPYVPIATALREALAGIEIDVQRLPALSRILPELTLNDAALGFADVDVLEALVELIGEHAPLVLLLDDLHWADPSTVGALSYLQRRCAGAPIAIVGTISNEQAPARPSRPPAQTRRARVRLGPLTASDLAPLGMPDLHESTGGNPRFVTQAMANGGDGPLATALAETLLAQCRAEGPQAYRILLAASVLEQPFEPEPLAAVLRIDATTLVEELDRLCEHRILRVDGQRFRFRYGLVRETLGASLSPARVRLLRAQLDGREEELSSTAVERPVAPVRG